MDRYCRTLENDDHLNMYGIRKITYWEKYGVQRFPYHGKRRYTPYIYQSFDGGIIISNDVFGLTIKQFEQTYKKCLEKRKEHEQWILNLRYPDKSSKEYLEYLQNCTDCNKDHLPWPSNNFYEKYLYENLVITVGTEIDIRTRQRFFIIVDIIENECPTDGEYISSGSLAEGLDLQGSDVDIMMVVDGVDVVRNVRNIKHQTNALVMETDSDYPGFSRLRLIAEDEENIYIPSECFESTPEGVYVSVNGFIDWIKAWQLQQLYRHGPCLSDKDQQIDLAFCLKSKYFPYQAIPWTIRHRYQWPPDNVVDRIANYGCLIVPIGPRTLSDSHLLWRISFSVAEKQLVHSFNFTQLLCYGLLKLTLKSIINTNDDVKDLLCSYFLKTALFWVSEEVDINTFQLSHLFICFTHCIKKLIVWVNNCYCPNYFIPEHNMFLGKITPDNNETLLHVLDSILFYGIDGLIDNLFPLGSTNSDISFIRLDFLFYKISVLAKKRDISNWYKLLKITEFLIKSESSAFIIDVCKYHFAKISQFVAQLLLPQTTNSEKYYLHKCHHRHLQDGIKSDAVSGWLLYASFYYVTGQYKVTLRITDYVLSRSTPDMVYITCSHYDENDIKNYRQNVHKSLNLNAKIKMATVDRTVYMHNSKLIPEELQLEVEKDGISVSPVVMSRFLRLLCYHHLGDILKRQQALRDLYLTVENCPLTKLEELSHSITILGVGYEVSGDKYTAYQCYDEALQCDDSICLSAQTRKSKLFEV